LNGNDFRQELLARACQLAFSRGGDAAALAFRDGWEKDDSGLEKLDLTALSSIHRMSNGSVELKFIDRIKLIELLLMSPGTGGAQESDGFIQALDRAARRLGDSGDGGGAEVNGDDI